MMLLISVTQVSFRTIILARKYKILFIKTYPMLCTKDTKLQPQRTKCIGRVKSDEADRTRSKSLLGQIMCIGRYLLTRLHCDSFNTFVLYFILMQLMHLRLKQKSFDRYFTLYKQIFLIFPLHFYVRRSWDGIKYWQLTVARGFIRYFQGFKNGHIRLVPVPRHTYVSTFFTKQ